MHPAALRAGGRIRHRRAVGENEAVGCTRTDAGDEPFVPAIGVWRHGELAAADPQVDRIAAATPDAKTHAVRLQARAPAG